MEYGGENAGEPGGNAVSLRRRYLARMRVRSVLLSVVSQKVGGNNLKIGLTPWSFTATALLGANACPVSFAFSGQSEGWRK